MANRDEPFARAERLIALAPVALVGVATALAFARVFEGGGATLRLLVATLASLAVAVAFERRGLLAATIASGVALIVAIGVLVFPTSTAWGFPTLETLRAIARALDRVGEQARTQIAPTPPLRPLMLAAVTALWTATFSAHALALRAGSPILSLVPPAALVGFADHVLEGEARLILAVLFLAGALGVVFTDGVRRIREWGPVWDADGRVRRGLPRHPARGAVRAAVAAIVVAAFVPGVLPGFGAGPLVDLENIDGSRRDARLNPLVSVAAQLQRDEVLPVMEVESPRASYWRMLSLEVFDGTSWDTPDRLLQNAREFGSGPLPNADFPVLTAEEERAGAFRQVFRVLNDASPWVPMAPAAVALELAITTFRYDPERQAAVVSGGLPAGSVYAVRSVQVAPTFEQLDAVEFSALIGRGSSYVQLPADLPPEIERIAEGWTSGEPTDFRKILAIQERFTSGAFRYNTDVAPEDSSSALVDFLTESREGFCQQFASAMAVLLRSLGYPARVAVGYRQGDPVEGRPDTFLVDSRDAHSWVEVRFPGYGWIAFEPTPTRPNPAATYFEAPTPECRASLADCDYSSVGPRGPGIEEPVGGQGIDDPRLGQDDFRNIRSLREGGVELSQAPAAAEEGRGPWIPFGVLLRLLGAIAVAFLVVTPVAKFTVRRWRLGRARGSRELILATYRVFDERAGDVGLARGDGETPEEYRRRLAARVRSTDGDLGRLTDLAVRAAYGPREPTDEDARRARGAGRRAIRDVRKSAGPLRTLVGIYRPPA
jgi:transglutaminase-like putative cysteine protease